MSQHYNPPRLEQLCRALKDTKADKHLLLVYMGLKLDTVKQFEIENCRQEGRTFMECLDYYLKNLTKPGQEWEPIVKALKDLNDPQTAQEIQKKYSKYNESIKSDVSYTHMQLSHMNQQQQPQVQEQMDMMISIQRLNLLHLLHIFPLSTLMNITSLQRQTKSLITLKR